MHSRLCERGIGIGTGNETLREADKEERLLLLLRLPKDERQEVHLWTSPRASRELAFLMALVRVWFTFTTFPDFLPSVRENSYWFARELDGMLEESRRVLGFRWLETWLQFW